MLQHTARPGTSPSLVGACTAYILPSMWSAVNLCSEYSFSSSSLAMRSTNIGTGSLRYTSPHLRPVLATLGGCSARCFNCRVIACLQLRLWLVGGAAIVGGCSSSAIGRPLKARVRDHVASRPLSKGHVELAHATVRAGARVAAVGPDACLTQSGGSQRYHGHGEKMGSLLAVQPICTEEGPVAMPYAPPPPPPPPAAVHH